jgi:hypothetical protein
MPGEHAKGVPLCSLWLNTTKDGREYYRGRLGDASIMGWINTEKTNEKQPDIRLMLYPAPTKREEGSERPAPKPKPAAGTPNSDDDIPY